MTITAEMTRLLAAEAQRAKRRKTVRKTVRSLLVTLFTNILLSFSGGWFLMLAVAVAHAGWIHTLPTIGYWWAVLLALLVQRVSPGPVITGRTTK